MVAASTFGILVDILKELGVSETQISPNTFIYRDLQLDSTETVEISLALKRRLGIKIKLETRQDKTLAELCQSIESAKSQ